MAISIDWITKVISVPQADLTQISATEYTLDTNAFHISLRDLEAAVAGAPFATTHTHNTEVVLGGITYARLIIIGGGYTVTFEAGVYAVTLLGSNNNILDEANLNSVSIRPTNAAGLIVGLGSGLSIGEQARLLLIERMLRNKLVTDPVTGLMTLSDDAGGILLEAQLYEDAAASQTYRGQGSERRERLETP